MAVLNDDVNQLERFLDVGASDIIGTVVNVVLVGAVFLIASPLLFLVAFAPIPASYRPGCGPCGTPRGCSVTLPASTPLRDENSPLT